MPTPLKPNDKLAVRRAITSYCSRAEAAEEKWHYDQVRPFRGFGQPPEGYHVDDCSAYESLIFNWAMHEVGVYMHDPLDERYSGWGNTSTSFAYLRQWRAPTGKYLVGDIAFYAIGTERAHVVVCRYRGTTTSSVWSSHGREAGPQALKLGYRDDLTGVYRHPQLR